MSKRSITARTHYFAYGSNMCRARLEKRVGTVEVRGVARLADYVHRFTKPGGDGTAKGNIEVEPGARVLGVVYGLVSEQLEELAVYEGGYRRIEVLAEVGEARLTAVTFVAERPSRRIPGPEPWYLDYYRRGIVQHGIGLDYYESLVAELRRR